MFLAEYVHRDISASNLLFYPAAGDGPSGRIGDLESARLFRPSRAPSDLKTVRMIASELVFFLNP